MATLPPYPLVNGHRYSFASIELAIEGQSYVGVTSIDYGEEVAPVEIYGSDGVRIGRTVGKRKLSAAVEMLRAEWDFLRGTMGASFGRKKLIATVQYSEGPSQPVVSDRIEGYLAKVEAANKEGPEGTAVKLAFDPTDLRWGGTGGVGAVDGTALEQDAGAGVDDFWLANAAGIEGPDFAPNPWDTVWIGGRPLPGLCSVKGLPTLAFQKKKAAGVDGAAITVNGYLPGPIDVECKVWTPNQWAFFRDHVAPLIWTPPNKGKLNAKQVRDTLGKSIYHPALKVWKISNVVVLGVSVMESVGDGGAIKLVRIKCQELVQSDGKDRTVTAKGSQAEVPLAKELIPARNEQPPKPSTTAIHPAGQPQSRVGGST